MTDMLTYVVDVVEMPADVRELMSTMLSEAPAAEGGCIILDGEEAEEAMFVEFVNMQFETARIQDGLDEPDIVQDFEDNPEYDEVLFQQYLNKACCTCGGPCEPGACEVLTGDEWGVYYG
jgi:hypothetical protein